MSSDYDPRQYGARWAEHYDEWHAGMMDDDGAVTVLNELAPAGGPILEFGVGTGRLAVPLAARGFDVVGIDISEEMLAQLHAKPSSAAGTVTTVVGDMTTVQLGREFELALIAFSSIFVLATQRDQVQLFRNAAAHLKPGGRFVLETTVVTAPAADGRNSQLRVVKLENDRMVLSAGLLDPVTSYYNGAFVMLEPGGASFYPVQGRNVSHHEMDLMAELAGLELENRWGDWKRSPFTPQSRLHISVYRKG